MRLTRVLKRMTAGRSKQRPIVTAAAVTALGLLCGGCGGPFKSFFDPSEMFTDTSRPIQNRILTSISTMYQGIDDPDDQFLNATDIRQEDLVAVSTDYKIDKGDTISVQVNELEGNGIPTVKTSRVSESGNLTLPLIGAIKAEGLTEDELQLAIADTYTRLKIINNPQVSATVVEQRGKTFSALGAVGAPGDYQILKSEFRMLDALVEIRDVGSTVDTVYVVRNESQDPPPGTKDTVRTAPAPSNPQPRPPEQNRPSGKVRDPLDRSMAHPPIDHPVYLQAAAGVGAGGTGGYGYPAPTGSGVPGNVGGGTPGAGGETGPSKFNFDMPPGMPKVRVIRVPLDALRNGDFRYNIVIRPHDLIIAPNPVTGFYYVGGHVGAPGAYTLNAQKITLTQAIISAHMLDGLAIPERTELIRRVGPNRQAMVRLNLAAIFAGTQPDIYMKANDVVQVGTNFLAPLIADLRNGFRITYGFGFLYDRNFAPQQTTG